MADVLWNRAVRALRAWSERVKKSEVERPKEGGRGRKGGREVMRRGERGERRVNN